VKEPAGLKLERYGGGSKSDHATGLLWLLIIPLSSGSAMATTTMSLFANLTMPP
jgi:hypothetical protein